MQNSKRKNKRKTNKQDKERRTKKELKNKRRKNKRRIKNKQTNKGKNTTSRTYQPNYLDIIGPFFIYPRKIYSPSFGATGKTVFQYSAVHLAPMTLQGGKRARYKEQKIKESGVLDRIELSSTKEEQKKYHVYKQEEKYEESIMYLKEDVFKGRSNIIM